MSSPNTIESDIYKLCPGQYIEIDLIDKGLKKQNIGALRNIFLIKNLMKKNFFQF